MAEAAMCLKRLAAAALAAIALAATPLQAVVVRAGGQSACAIYSDSAYCWGYSPPGWAPPTSISIGYPAAEFVAVHNNSVCGVVGDQFMEIALPFATNLNAGYVRAQHASTCFVSNDNDCFLNDGSLSCNGRDQFGQSGDGVPSAQPDEYRYQFQTVLPPLPATGLKFFGMSGAQSYGLGTIHACAGTSSGLWCWGSNDVGQLGGGPVGNQPVAVPVPVPSSWPANASIDALAVGGRHSCAVVQGDVWCWGDNASGELGNAIPTTYSSTPLKVPGLSLVTQLSAGRGFTCALAEGIVSCWGRNDRRQLGIPSNQLRNPVPTVVLAGGVTSLASGQDFSCSAMAGQVLCWGSNGAAQLGRGPASASPGGPAVITHIFSSSHEDIAPLSQDG